MSGQGEVFCQMLGILSSLEMPCSTVINIKGLRFRRSKTTIKLLKYLAKTFLHQSKYLVVLKKPLKLELKKQNQRPQSLQKTPQQRTLSPLKPQLCLKLKTVENNFELADAVYTPGPYSSVNKSPTSLIRYLPGYLKSSTMAELWKPQPGANLKWGGDDLVYGLGWAVRQRRKNYGFCLDHQHYVTHTGGAIGASSVLLVAPQPVQAGVRAPQGVVVAILCNMQGVGLNKLATDLAKTFQGFDQEKPVKVRKVYQC